MGPADLAMGLDRGLAQSRFSAYAAVSVDFSHARIPNSLRPILTRRLRCCQEEPAVRKALTAATNCGLQTILDAWR